MEHVLGVQFHRFKKFFLLLLSFGRLKRGGVIVPACVCVQNIKLESRRDSNTSGSVESRGAQYNPKEDGTVVSFELSPAGSLPLWAPANLNTFDGINIRAENKALTMALMNGLWASHGQCVNTD